MLYSPIRGPRHTLSAVHHLRRRDILNDRVIVCVIWARGQTDLVPFPQTCAS